MTQQLDVLYIGIMFGHGGDAVQMLELACGAAAHGKRVQIVVPELETSIGFAERCRSRGISVERSPWIRVHHSNSRQNLWSLFRLFRKYRASIVHIHTGDVCLPRLLLWALDLFQTPRVLATIQSPYDSLSPDEMRTKQWAAAVRRRFHKVVCPSDHSRETQIRYGLPSERLATIRNSVDLGQYGRGEASAAYTALGLPQGAPLIVFSSRIEQQKRPVDAVHAFSRVADEFPDVHLVFVGTGTLADEISRTAESLGIVPRVHLAGHQLNVPDWLAAATVWMLPTESENFSLAVLEALAAGCAVLSTQCPGNDEVLESEINALTTGVGDIEAMADGLRRLLSDSDLRGRLSAEGRRIAQNYSVERMVDQYLHCYEEALSHRSARPDIGYALRTLADRPTHDVGADE